MKVAVRGAVIMQVRPGCAFVLEWNLPFRNRGSATATVKKSFVTKALKAGFN